MRDCAKVAYLLYDCETGVWHENEFAMRVYLRKFVNKLNVKVSEALKLYLVD